jgi:uracil phosphoribosyltransferase
MMRASDRSYIVMDDRCNRSMQDFIADMANSEGRRGSSRHNYEIYQLNLLLPSPHDPQRVNSNTTTTTSTTTAKITTRDLFHHSGIRVGSLVTLLHELSSQSIHSVHDYSSGMLSATILANQSRRSDLSGPALQDVHQDMGRYLAERLLDEYGQRDMLVREASFTHVEGTTFHGLTTSGSSDTKHRIVIMALMRGGEPMARGVYKVFPSSQFVHYDDNEDDDSGHDNDDSSSTAFRSMLAVATHVMIVDSVVNEGKSIRRVLRHLLKIASSSIAGSPRPHMYVLTGVMQMQAARVMPVEFPHVRFLALRLSENMYTGRGGTDTGNRLFGTTTVQEE